MAIIHKFKLGIILASYLDLKYRIKMCHF